MTGASSPAPGVSPRGILAITVGLAIGFACLTAPHYLFNADASIQTTIPAPLQFATGRRTIKFPSTSSPEQLGWYVDVHRPDFLIVLNDSDHPYYQPADSEKLAIVRALFPGAWREAARLRGSTIYAFR